MASNTNTNTTTLYDLVIPTYTSGLQTLSHILTTASTHSSNLNLPTARLVPDQLPLTFQIHNATKHVHLSVSRLTGDAAGVANPPSYDATEDSFAQLLARVDRALEALKSVDKGRAGGFEGAETEIAWKNETHKISVRQAILEHNVPNFYFHLVTAYSILRAQGVPLGKADYLAAFLHL
ncbi:uncharacterized protein GGS25DRAFT_510080 [Hypoxylon fragiforme]|uniref:uncharacterized protein n=1 Tax=Hypoxylon fragiforme TaxID=63214 RepID=UPI0020C6B210|nr:uncharacterized protein GGS25DRAFT_510080 [Hypoxylon fragiforme]KAI2603132.1 hypothetical protein GGS25DRAFT_510080 [Hypoxylon fragiforme]